MTRNLFHSTAFVFAAMLGMSVDVFSQNAPLTLTGKLRDFREVVNSTDRSHPLTHPDFNDRNCGLFTGAVAQTISTGGAVGDTGVFKYDHREPTLISGFGPTGTRCYESQGHFTDWFNDKSMNRPYLLDMVFNYDPADRTYKYDDASFFPLDTKTPPEYKKIRPTDPDPFGHLNSGANAAHNFGFTFEFHAQFTYVAGSNQRFEFRGDDDVWVFVNGRLALDIGGVHSALTREFNLDQIAGSHDLVNGRDYILDFFFAERHTSASSLKITTTILLDRPVKVSTPTATPRGQDFISFREVFLQTTTPGTDVRIFYTTDGTTPDTVVRGSTKLFSMATPIQVIGSTTIKALATKPGWIPSDVMTETYTKTATTSTLEILDASGNPLVGGYLTENNTAYTVRLTTAQAGLSSANLTAVTKVETDNEPLSLTNPTNVLERFVYSSVVPFSIAAKAANGKTEASAYDSLTVTWTNPTPGSNETIIKTVAVRPAPKQARAYFSTRLDGSDTTDSYAGTETTIYLIVQDQVLPPGASRKALLTVTHAVPPGPGANSDRDSIALAPIPGKPGFLVAAIPVDLAGAITPGNGRLRLAIGDQITGTYLDPMDNEQPAVANAGFGITPVIDGNLQFTDANGNVLPPGIHYDPTLGTLYLKYTDDWADGTIASKSVSLTIVNNKGTAMGDTETVTLNLQVAQRSGSTGVWTGSIPLKDLLAITPRNNTAETYILGRVTASVTSHTSSTAAGPVVTDELLVAYPDIASKITLQDADSPGVAVSRVTDGLLVKLTDQSLSSGTDTMTVTLRCGQTGDVLQVRVVETAPGQYQSEVIRKTEGNAAVDSVIACAEKDIINARVTDPVYSTGDTVNVSWNNPVESRIYYTTLTGSDPITTVRESEADSFKVVVEATGKTLTSVDTISVTFITAQGEKETFKLVETGVHSQRFEALVPIAFVTGAPAQENRTLEGRITSRELNNSVVATGAFTMGGVEVKNDITLIAAFLQAKRAWIRDMNGDGAGDRVFVEFFKPMARQPDFLDAQWNTEDRPFVQVKGAKLTIAADPSLLVADYSSPAFERGLTHIPDGKSPKARLPNDALFAGQMVPIEDSIGPVIVKAVKVPGSVTNPNDPNFNNDTLRITPSEPITSGTDLKDMLKFSTNCDVGYAGARPVNATLLPVEDRNNPGTWIVIVNSADAPRTKECIYLNSDPNKVTDLNLNPPSKKGFVLEGRDRANIIQLFRGFPPVAGLDPKGSLYQAAAQDSRNPDKGGYTDAQGKLLWIPPAGFSATSDPTVQFTGSVPTNANSGQVGPPERNAIQDFPKDAEISALQVVSTAKYIADVSIYDNFGNQLTRFRQGFGYHGEFDNPDRRTKGGWAGFLVWNQRDKNKQLAGQGVYIWKVVFTFASGKQEIQYTRTGITRKRAN